MKGGIKWLSVVVAGAFALAVVVPFALAVAVVAGVLGLSGSDFECKDAL